MQGNNRDSAMGATEEILSPIRLSNIRPKAIREGSIATRRRATRRTSLPRARWSGGPTARRTSTRTAWATAGPRRSTRTASESGTEEPVILHKKTTTAPSIAPTLTLTLARPPTHHMSLAMTGQNTSAPPERNTITTAGQRCPSGRSPKNGWRENRGKRRRQRLLWSTVSPRTGTTEGRPCKQQQRPALLDRSRLRWRSPRRCSPASPSLRPLARGA